MLILEIGAATEMSFGAKNVPLRMAQYERSLDGGFTLGFARAIVCAKLANELDGLRQHAHNHREVPLKAPIDDLETSSRRASRADSPSTLLGVEGAASRVYFAAFALMLRSGLGFPGRHKRPPTDPVNALLSLGYTLLFSELASLLDAVGLDPYIGFYHRPDYTAAPRSPRT